MKASQRFALFLKRQEELRGTRLGKGDFHVSLRFSASVDLPPQLTETFPDEDDLRSYLLVFRHFILEKEPVFLGRILNLCQKHLASEIHREAARNARAGFKKALTTSGMSLSYNSLTLSPEATLDLFLNGLYFHSDESSAGLLADIPSSMLPVVKLNFLMGVISVSEVINYTASLLKDATAKALIDDDGKFTDSRSGRA